MKELLMAMLRIYKRLVSPMLPPACRYVPSCSEYAMEAVERHGAIRGSALAAWRLMRCHPFAKGGYDPVPSSERRVQSPEYEGQSSPCHSHPHGK